MAVVQKVDKIIARFTETPGLWRLPAVKGIDYRRV